MKTIRLFVQTLALLVLGMEPALAQNVRLHWTSPVNERYVTFFAEPRGEPPEEITYLVEPANPGSKLGEKWEIEAQTNHNLIPKNRDAGLEIFEDFKKAVWVPFKTNLLFDLGPGDGGRWLRIRYRNKNDDKPHWLGKVYVLESSGHWDSHRIFVHTSPPIVVFTNPKEHVTSQPMIQLKGFTSADLGKPLEYEVFDQSGTITAKGEGLVNDRYLDPATFEFTTNSFTCYDLDLNPGTNTIVLRGEDRAGFSFTNIFRMVFSTVGDTNPPVFLINSPEPGGKVSDESFTIRGPVDDPTAKMTGQISANGHTNNLSALIERNGYFWFEEVPLAEGTNRVTLVATDAAGNSSTTNFVIYGANDVRIRMDPVEPADQLWQPKISVVTGKVVPANREVWINGVQATVKTDGTWLAKDVPVISSPSGGTALFSMASESPADLANGNVKTGGQLSTQASLGTNDIVLNATIPACGVFQLRLNETAGRRFILQVSTNLVQWEPILTNSIPNPTFEYTDTNMNNYPCRFFKVVPLQ